MNKTLESVQQAYIKMKLDEAKKKPGNYVSIGVLNFKVPKFAIPKTGKILSRDKRHVTLIYSENTDISKKTIEEALSSFPEKIIAKPNGYAIFDNPDDEKTCTLVLKVESKNLEDMSKKLLDIGCKHSYDSINHHISIAYGVDKNEANEIVKNQVEDSNEIILGGLTIEPIVDDWDKV
jgi:hypothetical protein